MPKRVTYGEHKGAWFDLEELQDRAYLVNGNVARKVRYVDEVKEDTIIEIKSRYYRVFLADLFRKKFYLERIFD